MRNEFARNLDLAQAKIQYDEQCKKVLGDKNILSWIMQRTVSEYAGMSREEIMKCIEGEPEIGSRRVNREKQMHRGLRDCRMRIR